MTSYIVTLNLKKTSDAPYSRLNDELLRLKGQWVEGTTWLVDVNETAEQLQEYLRRYLESGERAYAAKLSRNHEFCGRPALSEWIRRHPPLR